MRVEGRPSARGKEKTSQNHWFFKIERAKNRDMNKRKSNVKSFVVLSPQRTSILPETMSNIDKYIMEVHRSDYRMAELSVSETRTFWKQKKAKQCINRSKHFLQIFIFCDLKLELKPFGKFTLLCQLLFCFCPLIPLPITFFSPFILRSSTPTWFSCHPART